MNKHVVGEIFKVVPEIDFDSGYQYYLYNFHNYSKAILSTLKSVKSKLPLLRHMAETKEYEGLRMITQTMRRMMGGIGGALIADRSYDLEVALLNQEDTFNDTLIEYLCNLEDLASRMEELVKKLGMSYVKEGSQDQGSYFKHDFTKTRESIQLSTDYIKKKII